VVRKVVAHRALRIDGQRRRAREVQTTLAVDVERSIELGRRDARRVAGEVVVECQLPATLRLPINEELGERRHAVERSEFDGHFAACRNRPRRTERHGETTGTSCEGCAADTQIEPAVAQRGAVRRVVDIGANVEPDILDQRLVGRSEREALQTERCSGPQLDRAVGCCSHVIDGLRERARYRPVRQIRVYPREIQAIDPDGREFAFAEAPLGILAVEFGGERCERTHADDRRPCATTEFHAERARIDACGADTDVGLDTRHQIRWQAVIWQLGRERWQGQDAIDIEAPGQLHARCRRAFRGEGQTCVEIESDEFALTDPERKPLDVQAQRTVVEADGRLTRERDGLGHRDAIVEVHAIRTERCCRRHGQRLIARAQFEGAAERPFAQYRIGQEAVQPRHRQCAEREACQGMRALEHGGRRIDRHHQRFAETERQQGLALVILERRDQGRDLERAGVEHGLECVGPA